VYAFRAHCAAFSTRPWAAHAQKATFRVRPGLLYSVLWGGAPVAAHAIVQEATLKAARCAQEIHHRLHMYAVGCNKHRRRNAIESLHFASRCVRLAINSRRDVPPAHIVPGLATGTRR
jgi:hypothetical protein